MTPTRKKISLTTAPTVDKGGHGYYLPTDKKTHVLSVGLRYVRSLTDKETEGDKNGLNGQNLSPPPFLAYPCVAYV